MSLELVGEWAFIIGVVVAVVAGIVAAVAGIGTATAGMITLFLVVLGLIIGFLNITDKEIKTFLIAAIALVAVGTSQLNTIDQIPVLGAGGLMLGSILQLVVVNIAVFVAPAALVVALKAVYSMSRKPEQSALSKQV